MIEFIWDSGFKKSYKKNISSNPKLKQKFTETLKLFASSPFHPLLRTHKLSGNPKDCFSFSLCYDLNKVLLIDLGSHEQVY